MLAKHLSAIDQQPYYTPLNLFFNRLQRNLGETFDIRLLVKKIKTSLNHSKCIWTESNLSRSPFDIRQKYISAVSVTTRIIEKRPRLRLFARQFIRSPENKTDHHISSLHLIRCIKKNIRQAISHNLKNGLRFFDISFSRILMLTDSTFAVSCIWRHNEPDEGWCSIMPNASIVAWHLPPLIP